MYRFLIAPRALLRPAVFCCLGALLFLNGCTASQTAPVVPPVAVAPVDDRIIVPVPEEEVEAAALPVPPVDDGLPLTNPEEYALASCSELDADIAPEDFHDVELHFKYILHRGRAGFQRSLERAAPYLPYVRQVFREHGVPEEIAYLAFVESAYNPNAVSRAGAAGMWQFMPSTGRLFGLQQSWWADERRDPYKATVAAAQYLSQLHERFGDWGLAMAAYNAGEGKIARALEGTGAENFFDLCNKNDMLAAKARLRAETRQYVPRFMAIIKIMRNLEILGFTPPELPEEALVQALEVKPGTDLMALARSLGMEWSHFAALNPAMFRYVTPPNAKATIYLPPQHMEKAVAHLQNPPRSYSGWQLYTVRQGDTYSHISSRTGVPVSVLMQANNTRSTALRIGQKLMIPGMPQRSGSSTVTAANTRTSQPRAAAAPVAVPAGGTRYVVQQGDTLYDIAQRSGLTVAVIQKTNNLTNSRLSIGQTLVLPAAQKPATTPAAAPTTTAAASGTRYVVQQGDTLYGIASKMGLTVERIQKANNITSTRLKIGQVLILPGNS